MQQERWRNSGTETARKTPSLGQEFQCKYSFLFLFFLSLSLPLTNDLPGSAEILPSDFSAAFEMILITRLLAGSLPKPFWDLPPSADHKGHTQHKLEQPCGHSNLHWWRHPTKKPLHCWSTQLYLAPGHKQEDGQKWRITHNDIPRATENSATPANSCLAA